MEIARAVVIVIHPIAAIVLIWLFFNQRRWREKSTLLKGLERKQALLDHESSGDKLAIASVTIVALAFASNAARGVIDHDDVTRYLIPGFHGITGLIGLFLMLYLWRLGRKTKAQQESRESFSKIKEMHGKVSDLLGMLIVIHAFLGFLYLLNIF